MRRASRPDPPVYTPRPHPGQGGRRGDAPIAIGWTNAIDATVVEMRGLEPRASCVQSRCSPI